MVVVVVVWRAGGGVGVPQKSRSLLFLPAVPLGLLPRRARGAEEKEGWGRDERVWRPLLWWGPGQRSGWLG